MSGPNAPAAVGAQDYRTPPEFLARVLRRLGWPRFDFDLACEDHNAVADLGFIHCCNDALTEPWTGLEGLKCWLNPPFAQAGAFARKCAGSGLSIAALFPVALGTRWWREAVHKQAVVLACGRLRFNLPNGTPAKAAINRDVALCVYRYTRDCTSWYPLEDWNTW